MSDGEPESSVDTNMEASPRYFELQGVAEESTDFPAAPTEQQTNTSGAGDQAQNLLLEHLKLTLETGRSSTASPSGPPDVASSSSFDGLQSRTMTPTQPTSVSFVEPSTVPSPTTVPEETRPKTEFEILSDHLSKDPQDGATWQHFITLADQSGDLETIGNAYDRLLEAFPNTVSVPVVFSKSDSR